jgi:hypothetical protein
MTQDETDFCNLVHRNAPGYFAVGVKLDRSGQFYSLRLKGLGELENEAKYFTASTDQFDSIRPRSGASLHPNIA